MEITDLLVGRVTLAKQSPDFILEIADRLEPEVRRAFLRAVEALKKAIPVNQIADLLDDGRLTEALSSLSDVPLPDLTEIRDAIANAAIRTSESVAVEFGMNFALVNERAVRWAQQHAGNMITNVNRETVKAVRDIIVRGQREGLNVRNQAQLIRSVVGLTDRDARAVDRFYTGLLEDVSERQARRQRDIMANRLLRRRAENIARTETIRASNMGTQLGWEAAQDEGFLPASSQKVWIATEDSRTCPICAVLDGEVVGMRDGFNVDRQAVSFTQEGEDFRVAETVPLKRPSIERTPPAHPSCRCTTGLVFEQLAPALQPIGDRRLVDAGSGLVKAAPKKHQERFAEALSILDDELDALPVHVRSRYIQSLDRIEDFKVTTTAPSRAGRGLKRGVFKSSRTGITEGKWPRLEMETRNYNEDWIRWSLEGGTGPEPDLLRFAEPREIASALHHELTHAIDYFDDLDRSLAGTPLKRRRVRWVENGHHQEFRKLKDTFTEFTYGASAPNESMAEAARMYSFGLEGEVSRRGRIGQMTPTEWRTTFPELAKAVEDLIWDLR